MSSQSAAPLEKLDAVCKMLSITPGIAYGLLRKGMPCRRFNRRVLRFDLAEVKAWVDQHKEGDK